MAKRLINKRLLNEYYNNEMAPSGNLFEQREGHLDRSTFVFLSIFGMEIAKYPNLGLKAMSTDNFQYRHCLIGHSSSMPNQYASYSALKTIWK